VPRALRRLRIVVSVILIGLGVVLIFVPLPPWMIIEQALCGALLLATAGDTSPAVTATIISSSSATPAVISPSRINACPWPRLPRVTRSRSAKRSPILAT
jgi:hypothetical protein